MARMWSCVPLTKLADHLKKALVAPAQGTTVLPAGWRLSSLAVTARSHGLFCNDFFCSEVMNAESVSIVLSFPAQWKNLPAQG